MSHTIVIADDHPIYRDGLVRSLEESGEFSVVGTASSAAEVVELAASVRPDIALVDHSMPGDGLNAVKELKDAKTVRHIVMLTVSEDEEIVEAAMTSGASGYILKGISATNLREILNEIASGSSYVSPQLAAKLLSSTRSEHSDDDSALKTLTSREEDVLRLVAKGMSNKEIANAIDLQEKTVKHHMSAILGKLQARNRVEAALIGFKAWGEDEA